VFDRVRIDPNDSRYIGCVGRAYDDGHNGSDASKTKAPRPIAGARIAVLSLVLTGDRSTAR
jgi:hypothetical protein